MRWLMVAVLLLFVLAPAAAETVGFWSCVGRTCNWVEIESGNATGTPGGDGNNYPTSLTVTNDSGAHTLILGRNGLPDLSATFNDEGVSASVCASGEYSRWNGSTFTCHDDVSGGGGPSEPSSNGETLYDASQCDTSCGTYYEVLGT